MSLSELQRNVLDGIGERLKGQGHAYALKNIYPSGHYGNSDLSLSLRYKNILYFDFTFYCTVHEMENDTAPASLGGGWAVCDNGTSIEELNTKSEENRTFREGLGTTLLNTFWDEIKEKYSAAEDSQQLLEKFIRDGNDGLWEKEKIRENPRVIFYALRKNSLASPEFPQRTWQIRTNTANAEILGLHLGHAEYLFRRADLPGKIAQALHKIALQLSLK